MEKYINTKNRNTINISNKEKRIMPNNLKDLAKLYKTLEYQDLQFLKYKNKKEIYKDLRNERYQAITFAIEVVADEDVMRFRAENNNTVISKRIGESSYLDGMVSKEHEQSLMRDLNCIFDE